MHAFTHVCKRVCMYPCMCVCITPTQNMHKHTHIHTVASTIGGLLAIILIAFRQVVLSKGFYVTPEAMPAASAYLAIRAVSVPATLASYVGTGACLGLGDTVTPLIGILAASLANVFGDWFLICVLPFGVAGAAAATAASSYVGMFTCAASFFVLCFPL
jgi:Na+-driven multidrug efflux pump